MQLLRSQDEPSFSSTSRRFGNSASSLPLPGTSSGSQEALSKDTVLDLNWEAIWSYSVKDPNKLCEVLLEAIKVPISMLKTAKEGALPSNPPFLHPALVHRELYGSRKSRQSAVSDSNAVNPSINLELNEDDSSDSSEDESDDDGSSGSSSSSNSLSDRTESSSSAVGSKKQRWKWRHKPEVFELACKLLFRCAPDLLPCFVDYVSRGAQAAHLFVRGTPVGPTYFPSRALQAIPFMTTGMAPLPPGGEADKQKIAAVADVMSMAGRHLSGILLVLRADLWDVALDMIKREEKDSPNDDDAPELFSAALRDCMEKRQTGRMEQLWECIPASVTPLDIVHTISVFIAQQEQEGDHVKKDGERPSILANSDSQLTVGIFQGPLIKLIENHTKQ